MMETKRTVAHFNTAVAFILALLSLASANCVTEVLVTTTPIPKQTASKTPTPNLPAKVDVLAPAAVSPVAEPVATTEPARLSAKASPTATPSIKATSSVTGITSAMFATPPSPTATPTFTATPFPTPTVTNTPTTTPTVTHTPTVTPTPTPVPRVHDSSSSKPAVYGAAVVHNDIHIRVLDVERGWQDSGYFYFEAFDGCEFIRVELEVTNVGTASSFIIVENDMFRVRGTGIFGGGFICNGNPFRHGPSLDAFYSGAIGAGNAPVGNFISGIPDDATQLRLEFAQNYLDSKATIFLSLEPDLTSGESVSLPGTPTPSQTHTITPTPTVTPTPTPTPTSTATPTPNVTPTPTVTPTSTPIPTSTVTPTPTITPTPTPSTPSGISDELYETMQEDMLILVNTARGGEGLKLSTNQAAQNHAEDMRDRCYFSHTSLDGSVLRERFRRTGGGQWRGLGENIHLHGGCDGGLRPGTLRVLAADAHRSLMDSPGHRRNILNPSYDEVAFGFAFKPGGLWVVQVFIDR